jgi:predicted DCC family thiol-disulfide oxidoreductase YuxK
MTDKLLIYDGACAYCRGFVRLVRFLDRRKRIVALPFESPEAQALLHTQFGDNYGFAMYLFESDQVSCGAEAAQRIVESIALPRWIGWLIFWLYPSLVKLVSKLSHRRRSVCGPECAELSHRQQL